MVDAPKWGMLVCCFSSGFKLERYSSPQLKPEILGKLKQADKEAFSMAYALTFSYSTRVVYKLLGFKPEAALVEELLQSAYLNAWRSIKSFDYEKASFSTWLSTIVRNCVFDWMAKEKNQACIRVEFDDFDEFVSEIPAQESNSFDRVALEKLIELLPEKQKEVVQQHYFEGLTTTEIADRTGYPVGSVKVWLSRAVAKLREEVL